MATAKQLAAFKKAWAAKKRERSKKTTKKTVRKHNPSYYAIAVTTTLGGKGYLSTSKSTPKFDTLQSKAMRLSLKEARLLAPIVGKMVGIRNSKAVKICCPK